MKCEDVISLSGDPGLRPGTLRNPAVEAHRAVCSDCRQAAAALDALIRERTRQPPAPPHGAFDRTLRTVVNGAGHRRRESGRTRGFWFGMGAGGAIAAGLMLALVLLRPGIAPEPVVSVPFVTLALNEPRDVSISVDAPYALADAQIRVLLRGTVGLQGYEGQRELAWRTDLDRGVNRLSLPVIARGEQGGQLVVEVVHGERRRTFVVDVRTGV